MSGVSAEDRHRALELIAPLCRRESYQVVVIDGEPPSKARARFTSKGKPYTPKVTVAGEKRLAFAFDPLDGYEGNVAVGCVFYRSSRQRVDVDNLLKAVLDAGTRARMWQDDSQVTALIGILEHDRDWPRVVVAFGNHASSMTRGDDAMVTCEACGRRFLPAGRRRRELARWCSRACRTVLAEPVPCDHCGKPFKRRSANARYCSNPCRLAALHEQRRARRTAA